jgi:hypothetical protein
MRTMASDACGGALGVDEAGGDPDPRVAALEAQVADLARRCEALGGALIDAAFDRSRFVAERLAVPADLARARFGAGFHVDGAGRIVAKGPDGEVVYSRANPGEPAGFDEALEAMVDAHPERGRILKGPDADADEGAGGDAPWARRRLTRAEFGRLSPTEKFRASREVEIVDDGFGAGASPVIDSRRMGADGRRRLTRAEFGRLSPIDRFKASREAEVVD